MNEPKKPSGNPFGPLSYPPAKPGARVPARQPAVPLPRRTGDTPYTPRRWPQPDKKR